MLRAVAYEFLCIAIGKEIKIFQYNIFRDASEYKDLVISTYTF